MSHVSFAIVADDLTGAADCAAVFTVSGHRPLVVLGPHSDAELPLGVEVLAFSSDSRDLEPGAAADATAATVERMLAVQPRTWVKKVDSTLRGHVGCELRVMLDRLDPEACVISPAFPRAGRTMRAGRAYLHGEPLERTPLWSGADRAAVAHLPTLLAGHGIAAVGVARDELGGGELQRRVESGSHGQAFVVDADSEADLDAIVAAGLGSGRRILWVGSAGLAGALASACETTGRVRPVPAPGVVPSAASTAGPVLVAAGSAAAQTQRQLARLPSACGAAVEFVSPAGLLDDDPAARRRAARNLARASRDGRDAAVAITTDVGHRGERHPGRRLCDRFGELVGEAASGFGGLVLTGGDTARAVLTAIGVSALEIVGNVEPGMPASLTVPGRLSVVTKAGAFGDEDSLVRAIELLHRGAGRDQPVQLQVRSG